MNKLVTSTRTHHGLVAWCLAGSSGHLGLGMAGAFNAATSLAAEDKAAATAQGMDSSLTEIVVTARKAL